MGTRALWQGAPERYSFRRGCAASAGVTTLLIVAGGGAPTAEPSERLNLEPLRGDNGEAGEKPACWCCGCGRGAMNSQEAWGHRTASKTWETSEEKTEPRWLPARQAGGGDAYPVSRKDWL